MRLCYEPVLIEGTSLSTLQVEKVKKLVAAQDFVRTQLLRQSLSRWKHGHTALLQEISNKMLLAVQFMTVQTLGEMMFYIQQGIGTMRGAHETRGGRMTAQHVDRPSWKCMLIQYHHCAQRNAASFKRHT